MNKRIERLLDRQQIRPLRYCRCCAREIYPGPYGAPPPGRYCPDCRRLFRREVKR